MKLKTVIRLEGFHTIMSFLESIDYLMEGSGMERLFEVVYARNTVPHIMSSKVVSRALRAHLLVESALTCVLLDECTSGKESQDTLRLAFSKFQQGKLSIEKVHG